MKQKTLLILMIMFGWIGFVQADEQDFIDKLKSLDIDVQSIQSNPSLSRYEAVRLLDYADCFRCLLPDLQNHNMMTQNWWGEYLNDGLNKINKSFSDISFTGTNFNSQNYFYCIAYAAYHDYINGYPRSTSPFCPGKFCGTKQMSMGEYIDMAANIVASKKYSEYKANREQIQEWADNNNLSESQYGYMDIQDKGIISNAFAKCPNNECALTSLDQWKVYAKYCTHNLDQCGFDKFVYYGESQWPIAQLNILYQQDILDIIQINELEMQLEVSGDFALSLASAIGDMNNCNFDTDYDKDGVVNMSDNCIYTYNPSQTNHDEDVLGDVCDDDIDGDDILNAIGVVDSTGRVNAILFAQSKDKCLYTPGNECQDEQSQNYLKITTTMTQSYVPATICFVATCDEDIVSWDMGDGTKDQGKQVCHDYTQVGKYDVVAKCGNAIATTSFSVNRALSSYAGLQVRALPLTGTAPHKLGFWTQYKGDVSKVEWFVDGTFKIMDVHDRFAKVIDNPGQYQIKVQAYDGYNNAIGYSVLNVGVGEDSIGANLIANNLKPQIGSQIQFTTITNGFTQDDVSVVEWKFGDGQVVSNKQLTLNKTYEQGGYKTVRQKIYLNSGKKIENVIQLYVVDYYDVPKSAYLMSSPVQADVGDIISFKINTNNISIQDIKMIRWDFGDGNKLTFKQGLVNYIGRKHSYTSPGQYYVQAYLYMDNGDIYTTQSTILIQGQDMCLGSFTGFGCDMDDDGIPDMCDDDIDGDDIPNLLGLINFEQKDCVLSDNINKNLLNKHYQMSAKGANIDNCPFVSNQEQFDLDGDGIGDECDDGDDTQDLCDMDTDGDGIGDCDDACVNLPEDYNANQDADGCPEIQANIGESYVMTQCNQCPCPYAEYESQLWKGDKIRAVLMDSLGRIIYNFSGLKSIYQDVK